MGIHAELLPKLREEGEAMTPASFTKIVVAILWFIVGLLYHFNVLRATQGTVVFFICTLNAIVMLGGIE